MKRMILLVVVVLASCSAMADLIVAPNQPPRICDVVGDTIYTTEKPKWEIIGDVVVPKEPVRFEKSGTIYVEGKHEN